MSNQILILAEHGDLDCFVSPNFNSNLMLAKAAHYHFPGVKFDSLRTFSFNGLSVDDLILDARKAMLSGQTFQNSILYGILDKLKYFPGHKIAIWYASDFFDLPIVPLENLPDAILESALSETCEIYLQFQT